MNATLLTILLLLFDTVSSEVDLGLPTIQAICRVELTDGKVKEGIVSFGSGGYFYNYQPHGLYVRYEEGVESVQFFDLEFQSPDFDKFREGYEDLRIFYFHNETYAGSGYQLSNQGDSILTRTLVEKMTLHSTMKLYQEIPERMFVEEPGELKAISVSTNDIRFIEFLDSPSDQWLNLIAAARKRIKEEGLDWSDYQPPAWFHEIVKDKERTNYLMRFFPAD